jgi:aminoglycoside 6'-N-acetyltransferase I
MLDIIFKYVKESIEYQEQAAQILLSSFKELENMAWPNIESARKEVFECIQVPNICIGAFHKNSMVGWIGLRPLYEKTWELHPLVIDTKYQGMGIGKILIKELERIAKENGIIGIVLGTDDDTFRTSLSHVDLKEDNIFEEIKKIENIKKHPYEFYKRCGYIIVGVIPNANGKRKPDIWMWKEIG